MRDIPSQHLQIEALRQQLAQWEGTAIWRQSRENPDSLERVPALSSGCPAIDRALPEKGFRPGTLVEWLSGGEGDGTATLAFRAAAATLRAAAGAGRGGGMLVVLDRTGEFYPLAAVSLGSSEISRGLCRNASNNEKSDNQQRLIQNNQKSTWNEPRTSHGIEPGRLIVVHPGNKADHTWALDQALRCPAVAAVVAWPEALDGKLDGRTFRRLQLAAEQGGGLGLLIRPESVRGQPSWADVRLLVEPLPSKSPYGRPRRMRIVLLRCRGGRGEQTIEVEIDDETHPLP